MGKLQRFCRKCVHQYKTFKKCGREFANVIMQKVKTPFWEDYLNITRNCMANVFLLHLMILLQNVYITMLIYAEGKGSFYLKKCVDCGIVWIGQLLGPNGYLTYNEFKTKFQTVNTNYLLYGGILVAIKDYQRKLGLELKGIFVVTDAPVRVCWKMV